MVFVLAGQNWSMGEYWADSFQGYGVTTCKGVKQGRLPGARGTHYSSYWARFRIPCSNHNPHPLHYLADVNASPFTSCRTRETMLKSWGIFFCAKKATRLAQEYLDGSQYSTCAVLENIMAGWWPTPRDGDAEIGPCERDCRGMLLHLPLQIWSLITLDAPHYWHHERTCAPILMRPRAIFHRQYLKQTLDDDHQH